MHAIMEREKLSVVDQHVMKMLKLGPLDRFKARRSATISVPASILRRKRAARLYTFRGLGLALMGS